MSAFALSGFSDSAVLVVDGCGSAEDGPVARRTRRRHTAGRGPGCEIASLYHASGIDVEPLEKHLATSGRWLVRDDLAMPRFGSLGGMYSAVTKQIFDKYSEAGKVMGLASFEDPNFCAERFLRHFRAYGFDFSDRVPNLFRFNERWPVHKEQYQDLAPVDSGRS